MWDLVKSGTLWATRPARIVYSSRRKDVREYEPNSILAVEIDKNVDIEANTWIQSALAFASPSVNIEIIEPSQSLETATINDYLGTHLKQRPSAYLFIGKNPSQEKLAALKLLQIPYRVVEDLTPPADLQDYPADDPERAKWHKAIDRRHVIYAHFEQTEPIEKVLEAFRAARKNFPDLLLVISGLKAKDIPYQPYGYLCLNETPDLKNIQYADILVLKSDENTPVISSISMIQIVTQTHNLREIATEAMCRASAVVFYDVHPQGLGDLNQLTSAGMVWSVRKRESLGAALSQALSLEDSANTVWQSMSRLTETDNPLVEALEALVGMERAA